MDKLISIEEAKELIMLNFNKKYVPRKLLIDKCIESLHLSKKELSDKSPGGVFNASKCRFGNALDLLITSEYIAQDENKVLQKLKEEKPEVSVESVKRDNRIEKIVLDTLSKKACKRPQLLSEVSSFLVQKERGVTVQVARCDTGRIISELKKAGKIEEKNGTLSLFAPKKQETVNDVKKVFDALSDEELVDRSVALLQKWFTVNGYKNVVAENTDGPNDNGIDGIVEYEDLFGVKNIVILQVKHIAKKDKYVPLCEVREFVGVLAAHPTALKGVFITNAKYHKDTVKFVNSYKSKYFVLLDGTALCKIAKSCGYNFSKEQNNL